MARSKRGIWFKFGRFLTGVTVICFFLPFFGVSCGGMDVITVSGTDMVGGCKPGGLIADAEEKKNDHPGEMQSEIKIEKVDREPLAIVALLLAIVVFGLSWVRSRNSLIAACVVSIACLGALVGLYVKVGGELSSAVDKELAKDPTGAQMAKEADIDAGSRYGLWITCLGLIGIAGISGLAFREPEGAELQDPQRSTST
jgi:hypothetical protein